MFHILYEKGFFPNSQFDLAQVKATEDCVIATHGQPLIDIKKQNAVCDMQILRYIVWKKNCYPMWNESTKNKLSKKIR